MKCSLLLDAKAPSNVLLSMDICQVIAAEGDMGEDLLSSC